MHEVEIAGRKNAVAGFDKEACRDCYKDSVFGSQCGR